MAIIPFAQATKVSSISANHLFFVLMCLIQGCAPANDNDTSILKKPFFGILPTDTLVLIGPGTVSSNLSEYNGTFSADGTEFYYTVTFPGQSVIAFMKMDSDNTWSGPNIATFSGKHSDVDAILSPDGTRLFFTSFRPTGGSEGRANIWYVERHGDGWGEPKFIPLTEDGDYYSSSAYNGTIYFNVWKTGDIFRAVKADSGYVVEKVSGVINSDKGEGDPFISPNEDYLIFRGYDREVNYGMGDLYISFNIDGQWTKPENLGDKINSEADEICPLVTPDGKLFIFSSNRYVERFKPASLESLDPYKERFKTYDNGAYNIYSVSADFIEELRRKHR